MRLSRVIALSGLLFSLNASEWPDINPTVCGMAGLSVALPVGPSVLFSNPAWIADNGGPTLSLSVRDAFGIPGLILGESAVEGMVKGIRSGFGVRFLTLDSLYNECEAAAGAAFGSQRVSGGITAKLAYAGFNGGDKDMTPALTAGFRIRLSHDAAFACAVDNVWSGLVFERFAYAEPVFSAGFSYVKQQWLRTGLEAEYESRKPFNVRIGQEFTLSRFFKLRLGVRTEPLGFALGIRLNVRNIGADIAVGTHPDLGLSRLFGLQVSQSP